MKQICKRPLFLIILLCADAHAQVRIDTYGDTLKGKVKKMVEYGTFIISSPGGSQATTTKSIYSCDTVNGKEFIRFYNAQEKEIAGEVMQFDSKGHILEDRSYTDLDSMFRRRTYKYDVDGRQVEKLEVDYPFHASYPVDFSEVSTEFKDSLGERTKYTYDRIGRLSEMTVISIWDSRTATDQIAAYKYEAKGNKTEEYNLNLRICGQEQRYYLFYVGGKGYATKTLFKYDSLNRLAESTEYSEEKDPAPFLRNEHTGTLIGRKTLYNYSGRGEMATDLSVMSLFREADSSITTGTPMTLPNWAAKTYETQDYDRHGNVIKKTRWNQLVFERTIEYF